MPEMPERTTYSVDETAALLGISRNGAYEAIRRGEIPAIKIGGRIVVPRAALDRWLESAGQQSGTAA